MATIFYGKESLGEEVPQKIIRLLTRTQVLDKNDNVEAVLGSTILWGISDCIIAMDKQLVCFINSKGITHARYNYADIKSVSLQKKGLVERICIGIGGAKEIMLDVSAELSSTKAMYEFIIEKVRSNNEMPIQKTVSNADEILKYKKLLDMGAITEEEYVLKKKQLLGI